MNGTLFKCEMGVMVTPLFPKLWVLLECGVSKSKSSSSSISMLSFDELFSIAPPPAPRVSIQRVKSLGGHFACLCRGFDFYEVKKSCIFQKENWNTLTLLIIILVKSIQKEQIAQITHPVWPLICRNKPAINPKGFKSLDTNSTSRAGKKVEMLGTFAPATTYHK